MKKISVVMIILLLLILGGMNTSSKLSEVPIKTKLPPLPEGDTQQSKENKAKPSFILPLGQTIDQRFDVPQGYHRVRFEEGSYEEYIRSLPLKPHGSEVHYFDGSVKRNRGVHEAVVDMDVGKRDLQQCADAAIRIRAEYLYGQGKFDQICFQFTNGFPAEYIKWMEGYRISIEGNNTKWLKTAGPSNSYESFRKYLDIVFAYAGTLSLARELQPVEVEDLTIGDIIIKGGSPGHAVIVVDMIVHGKTGEKLFLLAQSYMPAQDIHVLSNPKDLEITPWYRIEQGKRLHTPEWTFDEVKIGRFK